jgi:hypothetical protein
MKPSCATARTSLLGHTGASSGRHSRGGGYCHPMTRGPQERCGRREGLNARGFATARCLGNGTRSRSQNILDRA